MYILYIKQDWYLLVPEKRASEATTYIIDEFARNIGDLAKKGK